MLLIALLLMSSPTSVRSRTQMYKRSLVSQQRLTSPFVQNETINIDPNRKLLATFMCARKPWCHAWCEVPSTDGNLYTLTNLIVSGGTFDSKGGASGSPLISCYSKRSHDFVFPSTTASLSATGSGMFPNRVIDHLTDGVYENDLQDCYYGEDKVNTPYVMVDFGDVKKFQFVTVILQPSGLNLDKFVNVNVRATNLTASNRALTGGVLVGSYTNPQPSYGEEVTFTTGQPMWARNIYFNTTSIYIQFCQLEIY